MSPHQLRKKSDDKLRIDFHEPNTCVHVLCMYNPAGVNDGKNITFDWRYDNLWHKRFAYIIQPCVQYFIFLIADNLTV